MSKSLFDQNKPKRKTVIGVVHLLPLAGSPHYEGRFSAIRSIALEDAHALAEGGVHALMIENYGDVPFTSGRVGAETVAQMTAIVEKIRTEVDLPLGVNVLRNDGRSALAIAAATRASFVRVNVLCSARVTDQGIIQGIAFDLLRDRRRLKAESVEIWADINVKHSAPVAVRPLAEEVADTIQRGCADALIVTGSGTGQKIDLQELSDIAMTAGKTPVLVGSGANKELIHNCLPLAAGFIVGTSFKKMGRVENRVDVDRVRDFILQLALD